MSKADFDACCLVLKDVEEIIGVYTLVPKYNTTSELMEIMQFTDNVITPACGLSKEDSAKMLSKISYYLTTLTFTNAMCNFRRTSILDFSEVPELDSFLQLIIPYQKRENITTDIEENTCYIFAYLRLLESLNTKYLSSLSYRYIRLFYFFIYCKWYSAASIIATFLIDQIFIGEDLDNSVRQKLDELIDSRKALDLVVEQYGVNSEPPKESRFKNLTNKINLNKPNVEELSKDPAPHSNHKLEINLEKSEPENKYFDNNNKTPKDPNNLGNFNSGMTKDSNFSNENDSQVELEDLVSKWTRGKQ